MKNIQKTRLILGLLLLGLLTACSDKGIEAQNMLNYNHISPVESFTIEDALPIMSDYITNEVGVEGDFSEVIQTMPLTTESIWKQNKVQVFFVHIPYALYDGIAIFDLEGQMLEMISGVQTLGVYNADLNNDDSYELVMNFQYGSGEDVSFIVAYDIKNKTAYDYNLGEFEKDIRIIVSEELNCLNIYGKNAYADIDTEKLEGKLAIVGEALVVK